MTMQIREVVIYHRDGRIREIKFNLGAVNIITGNSSTGKTTLIDIIEYCLGKSDFEVKIRKEIAMNIAYYGVLYQLVDRQIFIAKQVTSGKSRSSLYFQEGLDIGLPSLQELEDNYNDDDLKDYLSRLIGIPENEIEPDSNLAKYSANIRHTVFYLFMDNPTNGSELFYKQGKSIIARTITDTLPVLLKAVLPNYVPLLKELRQKKAQQRGLRAEIDNANELQMRGITLVPGLLLEAQNLGLFIPETPIETITNGRAILEELRSKGIPTVENASISDVSVLTELYQRQNELESQIIIEQARLAEYQAYERDATQYQRLASEHDHRLSMVDYFDEPNTNTDICPICGSVVQEDNAAVYELQQARRDIQQQLQTVHFKRPALTNVIDAIQTKTRNLRQDLKQVEVNIETILEEQRKNRVNQIPSQRIASFLGGIDMYLRLAPTSEDELSSLKNQLAKIDNEIDELQNLIEDALGEERLKSILTDISRYMTEYGSQIGEEYRGASFRFDLNKLTVFVDQRGDFRQFGLNVGSDKNYLQIHIILYLALHRYFIEHQCPVPSFLVIDQIDRPFYPDDVSNIEVENPEELMKDPDRQALMEIFELLSKTCEDFGIQIIVLQHANFPNEAYQDAVIENWRDGRALIPQDWIVIDDGTNQ